MRKKKLLSLLLVGTMVAGLITGCGSSSKDTSKSDSGKSKGGKVVLNVINYHVGTDYAADYYKYLFDAFKKTDEGKNVEFNFEEIPTTDAFNQKIKLLISSGDLPDIVLNGGNNRDRTCDPLLVRQMLSQLSYASINKFKMVTPRGIEPLLPP